MSAELCLPKMAGKSPPPKNWPRVMHPCIFSPILDING